MKNKRISLYMASGLVALLAACGQSEVKPLPEEPTVEAQLLSLNLNVNTFGDLGDNNPGNGVCATFIGSCSLRAAVEEANAWGAKDKINVPAGLYVLTSGRLNVTDSVVIKGAMEGVTTIDGNAYDSVFLVGEGEYEGRERIKVELHHLTIRNGYSQDGGGIFNYGAKLLVNKSTLMGNDAFTSGGAIYNAFDGILEVRYSTLRNNGNLGTVRGGAISNTAGSFVSIYKSAIYANQANRGGAIVSGGTLNMANTTVSHNLGEIDTGGIGNTGQLSMNNVTLAYNEGTIIEDDTGNAAGGLDNTGTVRMANTIIANNISHFGSAQDCLGNLNSMGYNLVEDTTDCTIGGDPTGNIIGIDPKLKTLAFNSGITQSHALFADSPARNAGNPAAPTGVGARCEPDDQRSMSRGVGPAGRCDMGAYEVAGAPGGKVSP